MPASPASPTIVECPVTPVAARPASANTAFPLTAGVEIECTYPRNSDEGYPIRVNLARQLRERGVPAICGFGVELPAGQAFDRAIHWHVGEDGSCGMELRSPIMRTKELMESQIRIVCEVLAAAGSDVNNHCGLHVHLGTRATTNVQLQKFHQYLVRHEDDMFRLVPRNRRTENYCAPLRSGEMSTVIANTVRGNPHYSWGIRPWFHQSRHETTEIRIQRGSIDATTITSWICLLQQMWLASQEAEYDPQWRVVRFINNLPTTTVAGFQSRASGRTIALNMLRPGGNDTVWMQEAKKYIRSFLSVPTNLAAPAALATSAASATNATPHA